MWVGKDECKYWRKVGTGWLGGWSVTDAADRMGSELFKKPFDKKHGELGKCV